MKPLVIFTTIALFILFIISAGMKAELHKPFILEAENFRLSSLSQRPTHIQSVELFKIGEAKKLVQNTDIKPIADQKIEIENNEVKIIPSAFIDSKFPDIAMRNPSTGGTVPPSSGNVSNPADIDSPIEPDINSEEVLREVSKMIDDSCPRCGGKNKKNSPDINDPKYRNELIAWNVWRSNLQNTIMDKSDVGGDFDDYGTIYLFTFNVSKYGTISNIKVTSNRPNNKDKIMKVHRAIMSLDSTKIVEFPKGSNRISVRFSGGFMLGDYTQYASPDDYYDYESVRVGR